MFVLDQNDQQKLNQYLNKILQKISLGKDIQAPKQPLAIVEHIINRYQQCIQNITQQINKKNIQFKQLQLEKDKYKQRCDKALQVTRSKKGSLSSEKSKHDERKQSSQTIGLSVKDKIKTKFQAIFGQNSNNTFTSNNLNKKQISKSVIINNEHPIQRISQNDQIIQDAKKNSNKLLQQINFLKNTIQSKNKTIKHLYQRMQIYQFKYQNTVDLQQKLQKVRVQNYQLIKKLQTYQKENQHLQKQLIQKHQQLKILNQYLQQQLREKQKIIEKYILEINQIRQQNNVLKKRIQLLQNQIQNKDDEYQKKTKDSEKENVELLKYLKQQLAEQMRKLVQLNGQKQKQKDQLKNKQRLVRQKLDICAYYIGRWIDYPKLDNQKFQDWYQKVKKYLKKYEYSSLEYSTQKWIREQKEKNQKIQMR